LALRTAAYSAAGRKDEAKESAQALLSFVPDFSLSRYRMLKMFRDPDDTKRVLDALRTAGLPD
jgi:hypothetical protein